MSGSYCNEGGLYPRTISEYDKNMMVGYSERYDVTCIQETVLEGMVEAYAGCTFGNVEPVLLKMGTGISELLFGKTRPIRFMTSIVLVDEKMDEWLCQFFMWDYLTSRDPILFVKGTCQVKDGM